MRIVLLHFTAAPVIGGVERVMAKHAELFDKAGHEVKVLAGETLPRAEELERSLGGAEVVIAHNLLTMPFQPALTLALWKAAERMTGTRFVAWVHDVAAANPDYVLPPGDLFRSASPRFAYVAVSGLRKRQLTETMVLPTERCRVIPNGIDPLEEWGFSPAWRRWVKEMGLLERDLVLLQPARLLRRKRVDLSLEVLAALRDAGCDAALLVTAPPDVHQAASRDYAGELRARRRSLGLERDAHFLTEVAEPEELHDHAQPCRPLGDEDVRAFYRFADAVLYPSREEGFGLPLLEAALHRLPIFCPRCEPLTEAAKGNAHFFPAHATPTEIAELVRHRAAESPAIHARKEVLRLYAWPVIFRKFMLPLLESRPPFPTL